MQEVPGSKDFLGPLAVGYFLVVDRLYHRYGVSKGGEGSTWKLPKYINEAVT